SARSVVNMIGACRFDASCASGTWFAACPFAGTHWVAPAGLLVCTHSKAKRLLRYSEVHLTGLDDHAPSKPLVTVSPALPRPHLFCQPNPCSSTLAAAGSGPTHLDGSCAPCALPKVWPPAMSATVSSSFIAMRPKVSRMSLPAASGSGLPFGPSGFT